MALVQLASYNFSTVENPLSDGGNFTTISDTAFTNALQVVSGNLCECTTVNKVGGSYWSGLTWSNDQYSEITIATSTGGLQQFIVLVRQGAFNSGTHYVLNLATSATPSSSKYTLLKYVANALTLLISPTTMTVTVGDVWRLSVTGTTLSVVRNGITLATVSDSSITSGSPGLGIGPATAITDAQVNLWAGGGVPVGPATQYVPYSGAGAEATIYYPDNHVQDVQYQPNLPINPVRQ